MKPFAFTIAAWLRHISQSYHDCAPYELRDPIADQLSTFFPKERSTHSILEYLSRVGLLIDDLKDAKIFWDQVSNILNDMMCKPMKRIVEQELI